MELININNRRYLGSKFKLIQFIKKSISEECGEYNRFLDLFGGTGVVGYNFNTENKGVIINDLLESNYISYKAWFGSNEYNTKKMMSFIMEYNNIKPKKDNYFSVNFADTYFSKENTIKIGFIREDIEKKYRKKEINSREKSILITSLLYAMDKIANTVGHYDAYRKTNDLDRILKLHMLDLPTCENNKNNQIFNKDANELVKEIEADVVYIDPPYNSRQYSDAYHLLENVATWKKPEVLGIAKKMDRTHIKSKYCTVSATRSFEELIKNIKAKYIVVSYNNMGKKGAGRSQAKMSDNEILEILQSVGKVTIKEISYNQFTTGKTNINEHKERLFICEIGGTPKEKIELAEIDLEELAKSPLNYTGGKYKLLKQILPRFPKKIDTFLDLFAGGANVGVNVEANKIICNDKQKQLVRILKLFKKHDQRMIINRIEKISENYSLSNSYQYGYNHYGCDSSNGLGKYNKGGYVKLRENYNSSNISEEKDFKLLTLIMYSFNNQIRFNNSEKFNLPTGKRDLNKSIRSNIKKFVEKISKINIEFTNKDFRKLKIEDPEKVFIYCDPPYLLGTASYNENGGWNKKDETDLLKLLKEYSNKGVRFALSNVVEHKGQIHQQLIDWCIENEFNINYLKYDYNNSNYQNKNKVTKTSEVLITNY